MWWIGAAAAYETDQITDRHVPLADALPAADLRMNALLRSAAAAANARTQCEGPDDRVYTVLVREIARRGSGSHLVTHRGAPRSLGFGRYSAWLETSDEVERREFIGRDNIFERVTAVDSPVLSLFGLCSTIRLGDVWLGTDKLDHFLDTGYQYNKRPTHEAAVRYGTTTERSYYGLWTSNSFSFGDLAANDAGYRFYKGLLTEGSVLRRGEDGCVAQVAPFTWADWVTPDFDEAIEPSVYSRRVGAGVRAQIASEPERYCPTWLALGGTAYDEALQTLTVPAYVGAKYPPRVDPYGLGDVCRDWTGAVGDDARRPPLGH